MNIKVCQGPGCENEFEAIPSNKKYCSITCKNNARYNDHQPTGEDLYEQAFTTYQPAIYESEPEVEEDDAAERMDFLRRENTRLNNLATKYKNSQDESFELILQAIAENVQRIEVTPPKTMPSFDPKDRELVFNPWNSDTQIGKVTPTYDTDKAYRRVEAYTDQMLARHEDLSSVYNMTKAHVYFLGDIVEGENIFPSQAHLIDTSVFAQATIDGPQMYGDQLRRLLEVFEEVQVYCVIGNHGRLGRFSNPETNFDRVLYQTLYWMFEKEPRIQFYIPKGHGESMFWAVDKIGNYATLLVHGDQFGPPSTRISYEKKILNWKNGGIPIPFNDVAMGHFHQNTKFTLGNTVVRIAGSTESHNTFAQERLGVMGRPSQHLQVVDPQVGVFWESDIYLD